MVAPDLTERRAGPPAKANPAPRLFTGDCLGGVARYGRLEGSVTSLLPVTPRGYPRPIRAAVSMLACVTTTLAQDGRSASRGFGDSGQGKRVCTASLRILGLCGPFLYCPDAR